MRKNREVVRYTQRCMDGRDYRNNILVHDSGDILVIRQIVNERDTALTLTKKKLLVAVDFSIVDGKLL